MRYFSFQVATLKLARARKGCVLGEIVRLSYWFSQKKNRSELSPQQCLTLQRSPSFSKGALTPQPQSESQFFTLTVALDGRSLGCVIYAGPSMVTVFLTMIISTLFHPLPGSPHEIINSAVARVSSPSQNLPLCQLPWSTTTRLSQYVCFSSYVLGLCACALVHTRRRDRLKANALLAVTTPFARSYISTVNPRR